VVTGGKGSIGTKNVGQKKNTRSERGVLKKNGGSWFTPSGDNGKHLEARKVQADIAWRGSDSTFFAKKGVKPVKGTGGADCAGGTRSFNPEEMGGRSLCKRVCS